MKLDVKRIIKTEDFCIGDQINIEFVDYGNLTATAQKVTKDGTLFLFDNIVSKKIRENKENMFDDEVLCWLNGSFLQSFPKKLQENISYITIPTYGQILGHVGKHYRHFEPDNDEQFELMKQRSNRMRYFYNNWCSWWLSNKMSNEPYYSCVDAFGGTGACIASKPNGIRPLFLLRKEK